MSAWMAGGTSSKVTENFRTNLERRRVKMLNRRQGSRWMWSETDNGADWVQEGTRIGCSGRAPLVAMMKATDLRNAHDRPPFRWLHRSFYGCVFVQGQV